jgi:nickel-dependent lactate racemase
MELYRIAEGPEGLSEKELRSCLLRSLEGKEPKRVLILPPDYTRFHSGAGTITNIYYHALTQRGAAVDILPALGTHAPLSPAQRETMFGDIPAERFFVHDWRRDVVKLGEIPADYVGGITEGLWRESVAVEINRRVLDEGYDLIISPGQVVPHEVIGMSNHGKNLFVGVGGSDMINKSHIIGAVYGMERMMGRDHTPVRKLFDYALAHFLSERPILWVLTVTTAPAGRIRTHGLFIGEDRRCLTEAVKLARQKNIDFVPRGVRKCVVYLDPEEFKSTWLGNKAVYRTRMMMADGGELLIFAPGVERFGEDPECDRLIRKYGYRGRSATLAALEAPGNTDLRANMGAAAHLIHGSPDGRFSVTYAVKRISQDEIRSVGYAAADYDEAAAKYDPAKLSYGRNAVDGEDVFFIPNPALGLWIDRERFEAQGASPLD